MFQSCNLDLSPGNHGQIPRAYLETYARLPVTFQGCSFNLGPRISNLTLGAHVHWAGGNWINGCQDLDALAGQDVTRPAIDTTSGCVIGPWLSLEDGSLTVSGSNLGLVSTDTGLPTRPQSAMLAIYEPRVRPHQFASMWMDSYGRLHHLWPQRQSFADLTLIHR